MIERGNVRQELARVQYTGRRRSRDVIRQSRFENIGREIVILETSRPRVIYRGSKPQDTARQYKYFAMDRHEWGTMPDSKCKHNHKHEADVAEWCRFGVVAHAAHVWTLQPPEGFKPGPQFGSCSKPEVRSASGSVRGSELKVLNRGISVHG